MVDATLGERAMSSASDSVGACLPATTSFALFSDFPIEQNGFCNPVAVGSGL